MLDFQGPSAVQNLLGILCSIHLSYGGERFFGHLHDVTDVVQCHLLPFATTSAAPARASSASVW